MVIQDEESVVEYDGLLDVAEELNMELIRTLQQPKYTLPFLQPGRLIRLLPATPEPPVVQVQLSTSNFHPLTSIMAAG